MDVEATVTSETDTELKLTANWPLVWLQAPGSTTILRKLSPGEFFENPEGPFQRQEIGAYHPRPDLHLGDRIIVQLYFPGGSP
jgi:hypothetical protein